MSAGKIIRHLDELHVAGQLSSYHYMAEAEHPWTLIIDGNDYTYSTREVEAFVLGTQIMGK